MDQIKLQEYFPEVKHGIIPLADLILVQNKFTPSLTNSGIYVPPSFQKEEAFLCSIGKVIAMGPLAFKNRKTLEDFPEGKAFVVGDFVYIPRTGDKLKRTIDGEEYEFVMLRDVDFLAKIEDINEFDIF